MGEQKRTSDPASTPGVTADAETDTVAHDDIVETASRELPHPPATATEELDEGVVSETDDGPDQGVSPGVG